MSASNGTAPARPLSRRELRERVEARAQAALLEGDGPRARALLESWAMWDDFGGSDLWDRVRPQSQDEPGGPWLPPSIPSDRRHGANWPVYRSQVELDQFRQQARLRLAVNAYAQGILENLTNNVIGKGFAYTIAPRTAKGEQPTPEQEAAVPKAQAVLDGFRDLNDWNGDADNDSDDAIGATVERETFRRVRGDGEAFIRFHFQDDGTTLIRFIEPEQVRDQGKLWTEGWTFGIQHQMNPFEDVRKRVAYSVFWPDPSAKGGAEGRDDGMWEEVPAAEVLHVLNHGTPSTVKRGLSSFLFDAGSAFDRAARGQRNASLGAAYRAAEGETWQHATATQASITNLQAQTGTLVGTDQQTGQPIYDERMRAPAIRRIPQGQERVALADDHSQEYQAAFQGDLRQALAAFCAPEFWASETSSGNYSNLESAAAPAVRAGQAEQDHYKKAFCRAMRKALAWAAECGKLPKNVLELVRIEVEAPAVLHRNELEKANEDKIGVETGWKDRQTCAEERGLDWATVEQRNDEESEKQQKRQMEMQQAKQGPGEEGGGAGKPAPFPAAGGGLKFPGKLQEGKEGGGGEGHWITKDGGQHIWLDGGKMHFAGPDGHQVAAVEPAGHGDRKPPHPPPEKLIGSLPAGHEEGTRKAPFEVDDFPPYLIEMDRESRAEAFKTAPTAKVPLADLIATQEHVWDKNLAHALSGGSAGKPHVVKSGGKYYIDDGTHRATAAKLRGEKDMEVVLLDLDKKPGAVHESKDAGGHDHKGSGPGGGQFTGQGGGGTGGGEGESGVKLGKASVSDDHYRQVATVAGKEYEVLASRDNEARDGWTLYFSTKGEGGDDTLKATGDSGHGAVAVMRAIGQSVNEFMTTKKPKSLSLEAERGQASRVRLYDRLTKKLAEKHGYDVKRRKGWLGGVTWALTRRADLHEARDATGHDHKGSGPGGGQFTGQGGGGGKRPTGKAGAAYDKLAGGDVKAVDRAMSGLSSQEAHAVADALGAPPGAVPSFRIKKHLAGKPGKGPEPAPAPAKSASAPAPGHPFDGKSKAEMAAELSQPAVNPWGLKAEDKAGVVPDVVAQVKAAQEKNSFARPSIRELYAAAREKHPGLGLRDFQQALFAGQQSGQLRLDPHTSAPGLADEADLRHMIPLDRERKFYVDLGRKLHESKDATGHDHKGAGPGGGQFTGDGDGGGGGDKEAPAEKDEAPAERPDRGKEPWRKEKSRTKQDAMIEKGREKQDASIEKGRKQEDNAVGTKRMKDDKATVKDREREDAATEKQRKQEDVAIDRGREKEDKEVEAERKGQDPDEQVPTPDEAKGQHGDTWPREEQWDWDDANRQKKRDVEDASLSAKRDGEDNALSDARDAFDEADSASREKEDAAVEAAREKEDAEREAAREKEDEEREAEREAEDDAEQDKWDDEDEKIDAARQKEDEARAARREAARKLREARGEG